MQATVVNGNLRIIKKNPTTVNVSGTGYAFSNLSSKFEENVDINGGTVDGADIASNVTVGTGKTLDVSAGILVLADNQISGDKVEGGTASTNTLQLGGAMNCNTQAMTTFGDINRNVDGTAKGSAVGGANTGAFTAITADSTSLDVTESAGIILENDETITNSTDGIVLINGIVSAGPGNSAGTFQSNGNYDVILKTGNSTTGSITITDC